MSERLDVSGEAAAQAPELFYVYEGLSSLNDYFNFEPDDRKGVMAALWRAKLYLPSSVEYFKAQQKWEGETMEWAYGDLADSYAFSVDPTFTADQINGESKTAENRRRFYTMIRPLNADQVSLGIQRILNFESDQAASVVSSSNTTEQ